MLTFGPSLLAKSWLQLQGLIYSVDNGYVTCPPMKKFLRVPLGTIKNIGATIWCLFIRLNQTGPKPPNGKVVTLSLLTLTVDNLTKSKVGLFFVCITIQVKIARKSH